MHTTLLELLAEDLLFVPYEVEGGWTYRVPAKGGTKEVRPLSTEKAAIADAEAYVGTLSPEDF